TDTAGIPIRSAVADDSGRVVIGVPHGRMFMISVRHIGHAPQSARYGPLSVRDTLRLALVLRRIDLARDTIFVVATRTKHWYNDVTPGRELFLKHFLEGKGLFVGGREIEASGLPISEFLAQVPGLTLSPVRPAGGPSFRTYDGRYLTTASGAACLVVRSDRPNLSRGIDDIE